MWNKVHFVTCDTYDNRSWFRKHKTAWCEWRGITRNKADFLNARKRAKQYKLTVGSLFPTSDTRFHTIQYLKTLDFQSRKYRTIIAYLKLNNLYPCWTGPTLSWRSLTDYFSNRWKEIRALYFYKTKAEALSLSKKINKIPRTPLKL